jgi:glycosyltransferase involved in cell wall biosynthesis
VTGRAPRIRVLLALATSAGGVGRHVAELASGLAGAPGYDVRVCGPQRPAAGLIGDETAGTASAAAHFAFDRVDIADRPRPPADVRAVLRLRSLMAGQDVVHAHGLRAGALAALAGALMPRRRRPALIVTLHNALVSGGRIAVVHRVLEHTVAHRADVVLAVSADIQAAMGVAGAPDVRLAVVPAPPLPPARRSPGQVRAELGVPDGTALLVTVARLAPQKGLEVLVDAVAELSGAGAELSGAGPVVAVIAGDGPLREQLTGQARDRGAPVRLLGHRDDVADLIGAADLVVMPSRWEGQPLAAQEALRAGAALVATDAGGTAELVADGAVLVHPGDVQGLAAAISRLLGDPAGLERLRQQALARGARLPTARDALAHAQQVYGQVYEQVAIMRGSAVQKPG